MMETSIPISAAIGMDRRMRLHNQNSLPVIACWHCRRSSRYSGDLGGANFISYTPSHTRVTSVLYCAVWSDSSCDNPFGVFCSNSLSPLLRTWSCYIRSCRLGRPHDWIVLVMLRELIVQAAYLIAFSILVNACRCLGRLASTVLALMSLKPNPASGVEVKSPWRLLGLCTSSC